MKTCKDCGFFCYVSDRIDNLGKCDFACVDEYFYEDDEACEYFEEREAKK